MSGLIFLPSRAGGQAQCFDSNHLRERNWRGGPWPFALARKDRQIKSTNNA
jgi:hypothetical protein